MANNNYQVIAENLHQEGSTLEQILDHIKNLAYADSISSGINEPQSELFSLEVAQNACNHIQAIIDGVVSPILTERELSVMPAISEVQERLSICESCVYAVGAGTSFMRCKVCSCILDLKTRSHDARCPVGKW